MLSLRLDKRVERELDYIKFILNENQSQAVKEAIHAFYEILLKTKSQKMPSEILKSTGYIGSFTAEANLSTNYKKELTKNLKKKHGIK